MVLVFVVPLSDAVSVAVVLGRTRIDLVGEGERDDDAADAHRAQRADDERDALLVLQPKPPIGGHVRVHDGVIVVHLAAELSQNPRGGPALDVEEARGVEEAHVVGLVAVRDAILDALHLGGANLQAPDG